MKRYIYILYAILLFLTNFASAQELDSIQNRTIPTINQDQIEDFIQNSESEDFDFNDIFSALEHRIESPIHINKASKEDLEELQLLSDIQINDFFQYKANLGNFIALEELQSIPSFDLNTINLIRPYIRITGGLDDYHVPILKMMSSGRNEILTRWTRRLEQSRGYKYRSTYYTIDGIPDTSITSPAYQGNENAYYVRYKHSYENRMSYGITMEKDAGEAFFKGNNKRGFDFYSAHFYLKDYNKWIKDLSLGDYTISFGQGLILHNGFGRGKGSDVMNIRKGGRTLKKYSSVNEINFYRGAGITLNITHQIETTIFGSYRGRDGNLIQETDSLGNDIAQEFSSLQTSGYHRSIAEIEDKNAIQQLVVGGNLKYHKRNFHVGLNMLYNQLDKPLNRSTKPYSQFYFAGDKLFNASLDYSYIYKNINFFGETAISDNGAIATTNGALMVLNQGIDLALLHRHHPRDYQALDANAFGESRNARNEDGLYIGLEIRPFKRWKLSSYFDIYQHPWLQFDADAPSKGYDVQSRLTYYLKRKITAYLQVKYEVEEENLRGNISPTDYLQPYETFRIRFHFKNQLNKGIELRTRIAWGFARNGVNVDEHGSMIYQDIIYKPKSLPISFTTRFALFDTPSYAVRFYAFENDVLNAFSVSPYYNRGSRFYFNLRYRGIRKLTLEARFAQTYWRGQKGFSLGGNDEILGSTRTDIRVQAKYIF